MIEFEDAFSLVKRIVLSGARFYSLRRMPYSKRWLAGKSADRRWTTTTA